MGFTAYQNKLRGDFNTRMAANAPTTLIAWENREGAYFGGNATRQPAPVLKSSTAPWCRFAVRTADNIDISSGFRDDIGIVVVQVFGPPDKAAGQVEAVAETIAQQFRRRTVTIAGQDVIQFRSVSVKEIGIDPNGWYQVNVNARFARVEAA